MLEALPLSLQLSPYLRREGLRIKSQKPEDAFSPKRRSEGKHPTKSNFRRGHGGRAAAEEEARQTRIRCSSCRLAKLRKVKDPLSLLSLLFFLLLFFFLQQRDWRRTRSAEIIKRTTWRRLRGDVFIISLSLSSCAEHRESLHSFGGIFLLFLMG